MQFRLGGEGDMILKDILSVLPNELLNLIKGDSLEVDCLDICLDSRDIVDGSLFVALKGHESDGRNYIVDAVRNGANVVIYELSDITEMQREEVERAKVPCVGIADLADYVSALASQFFNHPSKNLQIYGITGTNGKTSSAFILAQVFNHLGYQTAFMGTIGVGDPEQLQTTSHTTLDAISMQRYLATLLENEFTHVCVEVSSHALDQGRVSAVDFYAVLYTNLSQDHLDYHQTMAAYAAAKKILFTEFQPTLAVINKSDDFGAAVIEQTNAEFIVSYGDHVSGADVVIEEMIASKKGLTVSIITDSLDFDVQTQLIGMVNVPNVNLVVATLLALGIEIHDIQSSMSHAIAAPGRMELYSMQGKPMVVVDYAHTPDALKLALKSCRMHCEGSLWVVFGCGGDRDKSKRAVMGSIAEQYADRVVVSNDNPRSEQPMSIINDITEKMKGSPMIIEDRAKAVAYAIEQAIEDDVILIAGKGHETGQTIGKETLPYSDRAWVKECMEIAA